MKTIAAIFCYLLIFSTLPTLATPLLSEVDEWMSPISKVHQLRGSKGCQKILIYLLQHELSPGLTIDDGRYVAILKDDTDDYIRIHDLFERVGMIVIKELTQSQLKASFETSATFGIGKNSRTEVLIKKDSQGQLSSIEMSFKTEPLYFLNHGFKCYR